ncbi:hypothetical protein OGAPHI_002426 [Ogataea philodendri]|uniref:Major facilitator superfamily (MFS) profile domain-containing protein n=1 Tax=Ogataea philodendri TaxID=1378263 RepID=A0A9P8PB09_9ASCO|nr:uncharacterized protein OGAPHI_002426 [Ogataea philodendri]KAH3668672.1 hypothetical protein OGAPHI_002426 [Ogataea philodendri]
MSAKDDPPDMAELKKIESDKGVVQEVPHTILTRREKHLMTILLSGMGTASSMSMPVYWVALTEIERDFKISEEQVNLTIVAYLVLQATAPVFLSTATDYIGRRPVILICLTGGIVVNVGLAVANAYWLIIFLRCLLATSVSPLISICSSVVSDFTTRKDRGGFNGTVNGCLLVGQAFAPFLGSLVDTGWNWRAIFYFCAIIDGALLVVIAVCLPETHRSVVGNLSAPPVHWYHKSPALWYFGDRLCDTERKTVEPSKLTKYNPFLTISFLKYPEVSMILLPSSILFSTWTIAQATLSTYLSKTYGYSSLKIGLCFFAPGFSTIAGAILSGKFMDFTYRLARNKHMKSNSDEPFDIIRARLQYFAIPAVVGAMASVIYGWCFQNRESVAILLVMISLITFTTMFPMSVVPTLFVDLFPQRSGSVASLNNLGRCGMATIFVACLSKMISSMTLGGTYTLMTGLILLSNVCVYYLVTRSRHFMHNIQLREQAAK